MNFKDPTGGAGVEGGRKVVHIAPPNMHMQPLPGGARNNDAEHAGTHSLTYLLTESLTHSLTHSLAGTRIQFQFQRNGGGNPGNPGIPGIPGNQPAKVEIRRKIILPPRGNVLQPDNKIQQQVHSLTHSLTHLLTYLLTHSLTYLLTRLLTRS